MPKGPRSRCNNNGTITRNLIVRFIQDYVKENGRVPTYQEIQVELEFPSTATVSYHMPQIVADGLVKFTDRRHWHMTKKGLCGD